MSSSTSPCSHLRTSYHNCFNRWYSDKFLKGQWDKEECGADWEKYRACLSQHVDKKHFGRFLEDESTISPAGQSYQPSSEEPLCKRKLEFLKYMHQDTVPQ